MGERGVCPACSEATEEEMCHFMYTVPLVRGTLLRSINCGSRRLVLAGKEEVRRVGILGRRTYFKD